MSILALALFALSGDPSVTVESIEGRQWWSVRAQDAPLARILDLIARRTGRRVEGAERLDPAALVTVELDRRPLEQVLEYVTGTAGSSFELRTDAVVIKDASATSGAQLVNEAADAWVRAAARFPTHPLAASALLGQGELAELQGDVGAAREHYETLIESYPEADELPEATLRTGRLLERQGLWSEASLRFRALSRLEAAEYASIARLELARCSTELGDPQTALHLLGALDSNDPSSDPLESSARQLVRAEALNALERSLEALRALDTIDLGADPLLRTQAMRARARALDGVGLPAEAARAWLFYAGEAEGSERVLALREAARLALAADDELGVLFVCREAERLGLAGELGPFGHQARLRLGLVADAPAANDLHGRLKSAEALLERGQGSQAAVVLEPLFLGRGALDPASGLRLLLAWADSLEQRFDVDQALRVLAEERDSFEDAGARSAIDAFAARLLEREGFYERAIDAYEGRY